MRLFPGGLRARDPERGDSEFGGERDGGDKNTKTNPVVTRVRIVVEPVGATDERTIEEVRPAAQNTRDISAGFQVIPFIILFIRILIFELIVFSP